MALSAEFIIALFFGIVGTLLALAAFFHSHWVHLRTFAFLKRAHDESMAATCRSDEHVPLSTRPTTRVTTESEILKQQFIAQVWKDHNRIYHYVKGHKTTPVTDGTWV